MMKTSLNFCHKLSNVQAFGVYHPQRCLSKSNNNFNPTLQLSECLFQIISHSCQLPPHISLKVQIRIEACTLSFLLKHLMGFVAKSRRAHFYKSYSVPMVPPTLQTCLLGASASCLQRTRSGYILLLSAPSNSS